MSTQKQDFNQQGLLGEYGYRRSDYLHGGFQMLKRSLDSDQPTQMIGDYIALRRDEDMLLAEKKVMNLVNLLNGQPLKNLSQFFKGKVLFQMTEEDFDEEDEDGSVSSSGSGSGAFIMRTLLDKGTSIPDARISLVDNGAITLFKEGIRDYCRSLSSTVSSGRDAVYHAATAKNSAPSASQSMSL